MNRGPSHPWIAIDIPAAHVSLMEREPHNAVMGWVTGTHQAGP